MKHLRVSMRGYAVMTQLVFEDADGVVHARYFTPETVCGIDVIAMRVMDQGKTHQVGTSLPLSRPTLPAVTCITCLTAMDT